MPRPPQLEPDVQFWIRVYTEIDTNSGFLHDEHDLTVVYEALHFAPEAPPAERERLVDDARDRISAALRRIVDAGEGPLSADDQRIKDAWGTAGTPVRLRQAVDEVRFQLGQSDRFRSGLIRSGAWETHIAETLANRGLPAELAVLPHVESSFNPAAYSKAGAAGLWQFMRSTGRRYMRIDTAVDDRLDPFRSTEAAAQLLAYNYHVLGTWPLALTAYNHGTAGVRHAVETLGTDDIVTIVRHYTSRTFGFASRNFYVSFLAALEIDHNPKKYFGALEREREVRFQEVQLPAYVPAAALTRTLQIDTDKLRALNPALLPGVWSGEQRVPRAYRLRLPREGTPLTNEQFAKQLSPEDMFAGQRSPRRYKVQQGDTLANIADRYGVSIETLARKNGLRTSAGLHAGHMLTIPEASPGLLVAANTPPPRRGVVTIIPLPPEVAPGGAVPVEVAQRESAEDAAAAAKSRAAAATNVEPLSAAQAEAVGPAIGPAAESTQSADPTDYSVAQDDTIRVAPDETLGHYADWLGISATRVRELNNMAGKSAVLIGERIKLDFHKVTHEVFEARRRDYHQQLQASYFAAHRIVGTEVYIARPGDSPWTLTQHGPRLPLWLLQQYNPDVDFSALRAGTQLVMPRVQEIAAGG